MRDAEGLAASGSVYAVLCCAALRFGLLWFAVQSLSPLQLKARVREEGFWTACEAAGEAYLWPAGLSPLPAMVSDLRLSLG